MRYAVIDYNNWRKNERYGWPQVLQLSFEPLRIFVEQRPLWLRHLGIQDRHGEGVAGDFGASYPQHADVISTHCQLEQRVGNFADVLKIELQSHGTVNLWKKSSQHEHMHKYEQSRRKVKSIVPGQQSSEMLLCSH